MQTYFPAGASGRSASHLLIHTGSARPALRVPRQAWNRFGLDVGCDDELPQPLSVKIEDGAGKHLLAIHDPAPLFDIVLPEGNYLITARQGEVEWHFAMHLQADIASDLHLQLDPVTAS
jgi:hypothetical protein